MSELIERLAKEAGLRKDGAGYTSEYSIHSVEPDDLAKFAALIAEECAKEYEYCCAVLEVGGFINDGCSARGMAKAFRAKFPPPEVTG
jgi:hypothetical protein